MKTKSHLRLHPDAVLRKKALPVEDIDEKVRALMNAMATIMYTCEGIGLAAPQVGVLRRVITADVGEGLICLANPEILSREGEEYLFEGCLSLPGITVNVRRDAVAVVRGMDAAGREFERMVTGLVARVLQHEIDHLDGVLILDHGPVVDRDSPQGTPQADKYHCEN
jgi:peptide deformylase